MWLCTIFNLFFVEYGDIVFWDRFSALCEKRGVKPNSIRDSISVSSSVITMWKNGSIPNGETLIKIADYFDCSVDYLLGRTDIPEVNKRDEEIAVYKVAARGGEKEIKLNAAQRAELERIINEHKDDDNSDLV